MKNVNNSDRSISLTSMPNQIAGGGVDVNTDAEGSVNVSDDAEIYGN